jgi:hypothetical protein
MTLHEEILEQPTCLERLLGVQRKQVEEIGRAIKSRNIQYAFQAAHFQCASAMRVL